MITNVKIFLQKPFAKVLKNNQQISFHVTQDIDEGFRCLSQE